MRYLQSSTSESSIQILIKCMPSLSNYQASVLLQGMGSLRAIATVSSVQELLSRTPLDHQTAKMVFQFFNSNGNDNNSSPL